MNLDLRAFRNETEWTSGILQIVLTVDEMWQCGRSRSRSTLTLPSCHPHFLSIDLSWSKETKYFCFRHFLCNFFQQCPFFSFIFCPQLGTLCVVLMCWGHMSRTPRFARATRGVTTNASMSRPDLLRRRDGGTEAKFHPLQRWCLGVMSVLGVSWSGQTMLCARKLTNLLNVDLPPPPNITADRVPKAQGSDHERPTAT